MSKKATCGIVALLLLISCQSIDGLLQHKLSPDPNKIYKRDMILKVNGYQGEGVLVLPESDKYTIEIETKQKIGLFTLQSCHREMAVENLGGRDGIFGDAKKVKVDYTPIKGLETDSCPVELAGYDKANGRHSWAFLQFESKDMALPALVKCNGLETNFRGISVCQARHGLIQEIAFVNNVVVSPEAGCPLGDISERTEGTVFQFEMHQGMCAYLFKDKKTGEYHALTTIGYEEILVRGD